MFSSTLIFSLICLVPSAQVSEVPTDISGSKTLTKLVRELVEEVRGYKDLVAEQGEYINSLVANYTEEVKDMKSDLKTTLDQVHGLQSTIDVMRSEVRLISQQKLTWQNSTLGNRFFQIFLWTVFID